MIKKFIDNYNNYIKSKANYFLKQKEFNEDAYKLIVKNSQTDSHDFALLNIVENYSFDEPSLMSDLLFFEELKQNSENENWVAFAEYYGRDWYYTIDTKKGNVFLVDINTNFLQFHCARDEASFINAISVVLELEILRYKNGLQPLKSALGDEYLQKCIEVAHIEGNSLFYRIILGV